MELVLDVYKTPYNADIPVVCMDESPKQLIKETRIPIERKPGSDAKEDYEYERCGVANIFMANEPLSGKRYVKVTFTVDLRDIDLERRNRYEAQLRGMIEHVCAKHHLTYQITEDWNSEPRYCATWLKEIIHQQCTNLHLDAPELMSGPFHDAMALSYATDYAMIFVRCKDGISHNPLEFASYEDLALGAEVLYGTVLEVLKR